ncbi:MAG: addiction module protein [Nitrospira sp.]|nr:addiction module protein [Nitrospira sp.]
MNTLALALERKTRRLFVTERAWLAERLLAEMQDVPLTAIDVAWVSEAEMRLSAWRRKATKTVSAEKALRDIRKELLR